MHTGTRCTRIRLASVPPSVVTRTCFATRRSHAGRPLGAPEHRHLLQVEHLKELARWRPQVDLVLSAFGQVGSRGRAAPAGLEGASTSTGPTAVSSAIGGQELGDLNVIIQVEERVEAETRAHGTGSCARSAAPCRPCAQKAQIRALKCRWVSLGVTWGVPRGALDIVAGQPPPPLLQGSRDRSGGSWTTRA